MQSAASGLMRSVLRLAVMLPWGVARLCSTPVLWLLRRLPMTGRLLAPVEQPVQHITKTAQALDQTEGDLLVHGELEAYAQRVVPQARYPWLYTVIPQDVRRSVAADGRIVNGQAMAPALAGLSVDEGVVEQAYLHSHDSAVRTGMTALTACAIIAAAVVVQPTFVHILSEVRAAGSQTMTATGGMGEYLARVGDVWTAADAQAAAEYVPGAWAAKAGEFLAAVISSLGGLFALLIAAAVGLVIGAPLAYGLARLTLIGTLRAEVWATASHGVRHLKKPYREALQRWRYRMYEREVEMRAYAEQVEFVTKIDNSPILEIGVAEGEAIGHGRLGAPARGTPIRMSMLDLTQHICVTGGSGEGKSRYFYQPLAAQLLKLRKEGWPVAIYATDDKAVIGREIAQMARDMGFPEEEIIEIGTGPNDWRVDLLDGLSPAEFSEIVTNAAAGARTGDDFWAEMGADLSTHILCVLQAAERTPQGREWSRVNAVRLYSIVSLLQSITSEEKLSQEITWVLDALAGLRQDPMGWAVLSDIPLSPLLDAIEYLSTKFIPMVDATKDGIVANARKSLRKFAVKPELQTGFADGAGEKLLPISRIHSNTIRTINISQVEHGSAGRLLLVLLKAQLFKLARQEEQADPAAAKAKLGWWYSCDKNDPIAESAYIDVFLADEYQAQAVAGSDGSGISDGTVWNVLRSARIAGVVLTQSRKAFDQAMGEVAASNMLLNFRTRIFMRTEDPATMREIKDLAGKVQRYQVADWRHYESTAAVERETGSGPDNVVAAEFVERTDAAAEASIGSLWVPISYALQPQAVEAYDEPYELDERFAIAETGEHAAAAAQSQQAAAWRMEDRNVAALQHLGAEADVITESQIQMMGRGRAAAFVQRGGLTQVDIVRLAAPKGYLQGNEAGALDLIESAV